MTPSCPTRRSSDLRNVRAAPEYPQPTPGEADDFFLHPTPRVRDAFDGLHDADDYDVLWNRDWAETGTISPETRYGRIMACLENDAEDLSYKRPFRRDILTCSQRTVHEQKSINRFLGTAPGGSEPISHRQDRKSVVSGKSVSVRVDLGGRRLIKKNTKTIQNITIP